MSSPTFIDLTGEDEDEGAVSVPPDVPTMPPSIDLALLCRPALAAPSCSQPRCVAICVCSNGITWASPGASYEQEDAATEVGDDDDNEHLEVSLWDVIDAMGDYASDADEEEEDATGAKPPQPAYEETTPSPRVDMQLPPRKRLLLRAEESAKHARLSGIGSSLRALSAR
jgi:hypothetical protein